MTHEKVVDVKILLQWPQFNQQGHHIHRIYDTVKWGICICDRDIVAEYIRKKLGEVTPNSPADRLLNHFEIRNCHAQFVSVSKIDHHERTFQYDEENGRFIEYDLGYYK